MSIIKHVTLQKIVAHDFRYVRRSNGIYFESDAEVTVRKNSALEKAEQNAHIVVPSNDNVTICTDSNIDKGSMSAIQLQELFFHFDAD